MAPREKAAAYVALRVDQSLCMENIEIAIQEIGAAYVAGMEAAKANRTPMAAVARAARDNERSRICSILFAPEAEGSRELARQLAFETDATVSQARALLAAAQHRELLDPCSDAFLRAALKGAGLQLNSSAPDPVMRTAAIPPAPSQKFNARVSGALGKRDFEERLARQAA